MGSSQKDFLSEFEPQELLMIRDALRNYFISAQKLTDSQFAVLCTTFAHVYDSIGSEFETSFDPDPLAGSFENTLPINRSKNEIKSKNENEIEPEIEIEIEN